MKCRACASGALFPVIDLGNMPLAGDFRKSGEPNRLYPLAIIGCESCGVLQVKQTVEPVFLFTPEYAYVSSAIASLVRHFEAYAAARALPPAERGKKTLLEIGCNDGIFLRPLENAGYRVMGVDASANVAEAARRKGLNVKTAVFGKALAKKMAAADGLFDVITCSNVLAHNPDVNDMLEGVLALLKPEGQFWVEVHSAHALYETLQWDCFYHEHCFNWTIHALASLGARHGLKLDRYELTDMHGGAYRAVFSRAGADAVISEPKLGPKDWQGFRERCLASRDEIRKKISALPLDYAYGAAGRAVILINWTGLGPKLRYAVDGNPLRIGKAIPNTGVPIISEEEFFSTKDPGEYCFVTAHNYVDGIRRKVEARFAGRSIRFVTPLPDVSIR